MRKNVDVLSAALHNCDCKLLEKYLLVLGHILGRRYLQTSINILILTFKQHHGDRMVVGITTVCSISAYHHYSMQLCDKFVSDLCQIGGILRFLQPIKMTVTI